MQELAYDELVNKFLRKMTPEFIIEKLYKPIDRACLSFKGRFVSTSSYQECLDELLRFDDHIMDNLLPGCDYSKTLDRKFRVQGIVKGFSPISHFLDVENGTNGGIRSMIDNHIREFKSAYLKGYIKDILNSEFGIIDQHDKFEFAKAFCRKSGYDFDSDPIYFWYDYDKAIYEYLQTKLHAYKHLR